MMQANSSQFLETKPTILMDGIVFSTEAYNRGMGRYAAFLLETLSRAGYDLCLILYKNCFIKKNDPILSLCKHITHIDIDPAVYNLQDIHHVTYQIESFARSYQACAFIDTTPFILPSYLDITSCPVIAVAYDLIPLKYPVEYLGHQEIHKSIYTNGLQRLRNANGIIAISQHTKEDVMHYLGISPEQIVVIYPSLQPQYLAPPPIPKQSKDFFSFLGGHASKNPKASLRLFNQLVQSSKRGYTICVPTSAQQLIIQTEFPQLTKKLHLQHTLTEEKKLKSQQEAKVIFHLSKEEGFGIPLLEALFLKKKVVCCNTKMNREILEKSQCTSPPFALILPCSLDKDSITKTLSFMEQENTEREEQYFQNLQNYFISHWQYEAVQNIKQIIESAIQNLCRFTKNIVAKMVCNTPAHSCGVADYAYHLCQGTSQNILFYTSDTTISKLNNLPNIRIKTFLSFPDDLSIQVPTLFHLAISDTLWFGIELMRLYGSSKDVLILHDHNWLYGLYFRYMQQQNIFQFLEYYFIGNDRQCAKEIRHLTCMSQQEFDQAVRGYQFEWLMKKQIRIIHHLPSPVQREFEILNSISIPQSAIFVPIGIHERTSPAISRRAAKWLREQNFLPRDFLIGIFGSITDNKYILESAVAIAKACHQRVSTKSEGNIHLIVCGKVSDSTIFYHSQQAFYSLGLNLHFHHHYSSDEEWFDSILTAMDIVLCCRKQDRGQLSHIIPRALSLGKPLFTNAKSGYSMLSPECIIEEDHFENNLIEKILFFMENRHLLQDISRHNRNLFTNQYNAQNMFHAMINLNKASS